MTLPQFEVVQPTAARQARPGRTPCGAFSRLGAGGGA
jgi:hypothetical protein